MTRRKNLKSLETAAVRRDLDLSAPSERTRRLRKTSVLRGMVRENSLHPDDFILPLFVEENLDERTPVKTMPGVWRDSESTIAGTVKNAAGEGLKAVMLFGVSHSKDEIGSDAYKKGGLQDRMIRRVKDDNPETVVIADLCFCEYTDHGHCGVMTPQGDVDNDRTLENLALQAITAAEAGADMVAPSGMMDGMVGAIREALDQTGFEDLPIMSYSTKFASNFYGPFRDAAGCSLGKGDRKSYQINPANGREAVRESLIDEAEGADILMVKPGLPYLDVIRDIRQETLLPVAAYQVSGEYAMIKFAAQAGAIDEKKVMMESLTAFKRAGADLILSYFAPDAVRELQK